jgi:hypothetical protein
MKFKQLYVLTCSYHLNQITLKMYSFFNNIVSTAFSTTSSGRTSVNNGSDRTWKKVVMAQSEVQLRNFTGSPDESHKTSQDSQCPGKDFKLGPSQHRTPPTWVINT